MNRGQLLLPKRMRLITTRSTQVNVKLLLVLVRKVRDNDEP